MRIRDAGESDIAHLRDIMNHYRQNSRSLWETALLTEDDMEVWLNEHSCPPYAALVAEEEEVIGFASLSCFRPYSGYRLTAENSIYLSPGYEGKGYGGALMRALLLRARENGLRVVTAWIDAENWNSVLFHERYGFRYVGCMRDVGVLDGESRSVVIMQYNME